MNSLGAPTRVEAFAQENIPVGYSVGWMEDPQYAVPTLCTPVVVGRAAIAAARFAARGCFRNCRRTQR